VASWDTALIPQVAYQNEDQVFKNNQSAPWTPVMGARCKCVLLLTT